jgi:hypothetical protein
MAAVAMRAKTGKKQAGAQAKPNRALLAVLGVLAVAAVLRLAVPALFGGGGGSVKPFTFTQPAVHLVRRAPQSSSSSVGSVSAVVRTARDPFAVPPGYTSR